MVFSSHGLRILFTAIFGAQLAFSGGVMLAASPSVPLEEHSYPIPTVNDVPVDGCAALDANCGQPSADQFCRWQGYERAISWSSTSDPATWNLGSRQFCHRSATLRCEGLRNVTCIAAPVGGLKPQRGEDIVLSVSNAGAAMPALATPPPLALPIETTHSAPLGDRIAALQRQLPAENYARLYADVCVTIARYERLVGWAEDFDGPAHADRAAPGVATWDTQYRVGLAGGPGPAQAVSTRLQALDKLLLRPARAALARDVEEIIRQSGG